MTHFTIQFHSKNFTYYYESQLTQHDKKYSPQHCQKPTHFTNFFFFLFLFGFRKKYCTGSFVDTQKLHCRNTWKAKVCIFLYISIRKFLFQRRRKLSVVTGGGLDNFLMEAHCLGLVKCLKILHFN